MSEHELLLKMTNGYSPPWNIAAKKYHCGFCYNYITKESHLKRPESHRIEYEISAQRVDRVLRKACEILGHDYTEETSP